MDRLLDVVSVKVQPDYRLLLEFENGEWRMSDMSPYIDKKPFNRLKNASMFHRAHIDYDTVVWSNMIDISPETLYDRSVAIMLVREVIRTKQPLDTPRNKRSSLDSPPHSAALHDGLRVSIRPSRPIIF